MATERIIGHCLCGAVEISAVPLTGEVSACHCSFCRRWTGSAMFGFEASAQDVEVSGTVATYRSSPFAERAFCPACGTHLWFRDDGKDYEFLPGLFDAAAGFPLDHEVYADRAFACARLAGNHPRQSGADYEKSHPFVEGDRP